MIKFILLVLFVFSVKSMAALEYSKIEFPGCPENSFCSLETGKTKQAWSETIDLLTKSKTNLQEVNKKIKQNTGHPISGWAKEEAQILPNIIMWDSPCKNHKGDLGTYYISEFFVKKINDQLLRDYSNLYFPKAYIVNAKKEMTSQFVSREDLPSFASDKGLHYLKSDEGKFYGLIITKEGHIEISDVAEFTRRPENSKIQPMIDAICTKEQIDLFKKEAPNSLFYEGYYCKNIWNISTKNFDNILFGRSCD